MGIHAGGGPGSESVENNRVWMRQHRRPGQLVDVIIHGASGTDDFLDPAVFRSEFDAGGAAGLMGGLRRGRVALPMPPGTGVADDKLDLCLCAGDDPLYYLDEEPIHRKRCPPTSARRLKTGPTCWATSRIWWSKIRSVKRRYGMLIGPHGLRRGDPALCLRRFRPSQ